MNSGKGKRGKGREVVELSEKIEGFECDKRGKWRKFQKHCSDNNLVL